MDIVVTSRRADVSERFRQVAQEKLGKFSRLDGKVISMDVEVTKEPNPRQSDHCERVEITCRTRGPVIRAEASAPDALSALDLAMDKLDTQLRKAADRRRVHHGRRNPLSVSQATAGLPLDLPEAQADAPADSGEQAPSPGVLREEGPMVVREKSHKANPMTLDDALYEMELVGHDFFLFIDKEAGLPSVVYRRRGYHYGVIRLES